MSALIRGNHKDFVKAQKNFVDFAINNFDIVKDAKYPEFTYPLFSKEAFRGLKVMFLEKFRFKTENEKTLEKMFADYKVSKAIDDNYRRSYRTSRH